MTKPKILNGLIIVDKDGTSNYQTNSGVEVPSEYFFSKVIDLDSEITKNWGLEVGDEVCVPKANLKETIPYKGNLHYACLSHHIKYFLSSGEKPEDKSF